MQKQVKIKKKTFVKLLIRPGELGLSRLQILSVICSTGK